MQDKIQEIMVLVDDVCDAFHADGFHHTEDNASNADALCALLKSKLRELVREPAKTANKVSVDSGVLKIVINALRRDCAEGRVVRGEMADEIEALITSASGEV